MGKARFSWILLMPLWAAVPGLCLELAATGHDSRIDLAWGGGQPRCHVYRGSQADGPFERLTNEPWKLTVYSDFLGENNKTYWYRVTAVDRQGNESLPAVASVGQ